MGKNFKVSEGSSEIEVTFESVIVPGAINIREKTPYDLPSGSFVATSDSQGTLMVDGSESVTVGKLYDITTSSSLIYHGTITVSIPYDQDLVRESEATELDVRFMHYKQGTWEDVTVSIDRRGNTVTGQLDSLSPVVAAIVMDGTFGSKYFELHPLERINDVKGDNGNASSEGEIVLVNSTGISISTAKAGTSLIVTNTLKNQQRVAQQYDYVVEILDSDNVVVDLMMQSATLAKAETRNIKQDWSVDQSGVYTIKIFVIEGLSEKAPVLLKNSISVVLIVK
jgi:hypothetical protein